MPGALGMIAPPRHLSPERGSTDVKGDLVKEKENMKQTL